MPSNYLAPPNAFMAGAAYADQLRAQERQENALAALIQRFGPEAADPVALGQLEGIRQRAELHPLEMAQVQRSNAAMEAVVGRHGAIAGDPTAQAINTAEESAGRTRAQQAALRAALFLEESQRRGANLGEAFDRVSRILPSIGFEAADLPQIREQVVNDPQAAQAFIAMMRGGEGGNRAMSSPIPVYDDQGRLRLMQPMSDGSMQLLEGVTPAAALQAETRLRQGEERLGQGWERLGLQELKQMGYDATPGHQYYRVQTPDGGFRIVADVIPGTEQSREAEALSAEQISSMRSDAQSALTTILNPAAAVQSEADRALSIMENSPWFSGNDVVRANARRVVGSVVAGTDPFDVRKAIATLHANIAFNQLSNMARGLGAVSEKELDLLQSVLGQLDVSMPPDVLRANIEKVKEMHADIVAKVESKIEENEARIRRVQSRRGASFGAPAPVPTASGMQPAGVAPAGVAPPPTSDAIPLDQLLEMYQ